MRHFGPWMAVFVAAALAVVPGCNDGPGPTVAPGNNVINDTHEPDATAPATTYDAGIDTGSGDATVYDATGDAGYSDVVIGMIEYDAPTPSGACASCTCSESTGYCLENGASGTASAGSGGACGVASAGALAVGCNALPAACAATPTCACVLSSMSPSLACVPDCVMQSPEGGTPYIDVYCPAP